MVNKKLEDSIVDVNQKSIEKKYNNLFINYFNNTIARNMSFMISGLVMLVIGFFNYSSYVSFFACSGMFFIIFSIYMLENDVKKHDLKKRLLSNDEIELTESTIKEDKVDIML